MPHNPFNTAALDQLVADQLKAEDFAPEFREHPPVPDKKKGAGIAPYAALWGGQLADAGSTLYGWSKGNVEANPMLTGSGDDYNPHPTGKMLGAKVGTAGLATLMMKLLESKGHPTAAKVLGYGGGLLGGIPAALNLDRAMRTKK